MEDCGFHHSTLFPRFSSCSITEQHFPQWPFNEMVSGHRQKSCRKQGKEAQSHWHIGSSVVPPSPGCHHVHPLETQNHRDTLIVFISRKTHVSHWGIMCFFCIGALNILWWYIYNIYICLKPPANFSQSQTRLVAAPKTAEFWWDLSSHRSMGTALLHRTGWYRLCWPSSQEWAIDIVQGREHATSISTKPCRIWYFHDITCLPMP